MIASPVQKSPLKELGN